MTKRLCLVFALLALLAGCAGLSSSLPGGEAPPTLASEQRRLAELFRDTPVVFRLRADGSLEVQVPLRYAFEPRRAAVLPPLAKVLDHVAAGQVRTTTLLRVWAPSDAGRGNARLARERAAATRDYLIARGVAVTRFAAVRAAEGDAVRIMVEPSPG